MFELGRLKIIYEGVTRVQPNAQTSAVDLHVGLFQTQILLECAEAHRDDLASTQKGGSVYPAEEHQRVANALSAIRSYRNRLVDARKVR